MIEAAPSRLSGGIAARPARPLIMGVVNVTPDSFSDGGCFADQSDALAHARALIAAGADVLDIGGESTRPGAAPVSADEEMARVLPLIRAVSALSETPISIDTMKPAVARAAVEAGATVWNDITALRHDSESLATAADLGCEVVLMHMQGEPATMQQAPHYDDVVEEVTAFLAGRAQAALAAGVERRRIWIDPGLGFGKSTRHNLALLKGMRRIAGLGYPVLVGASRKGLIRALDPAAREPSSRLGGSIALALTAAGAGAAMLRVHDVAETRQALEVWAGLGAQQ